MFFSWIVFAVILLVFIHAEERRYARLEARVDELEMRKCSDQLKAEAEEKAHDLRTDLDAKKDELVALFKKEMDKVRRGLK